MYAWQHLSNIQKTEHIQSKVTKIDTDIYGLKYRPSLEPHIENDRDWLGEPTPGPKYHFSPLNHQALEYAFGKLSHQPKLIVEIGVDAKGGVTSTHTLLRMKPKDCFYVGIDIDSKEHLNNIENNIFTLRNDSADYSKLYTFMDLHKLEQIDFMFIDGWHSVNQVIKEWNYWEKMIPNGVMAFHDTNYHPGPVALFDAIDTDIFSVEWFGRGESDWGVGVVQRLMV